jgi:hypothetical protein
MPSLCAHSTLSSAVCGEPRSSNKIMRQQRQCEWSLGDDNFIQGQDDRPLVRPEAVLEPPFTCCQFQARSASRWRGRFQAIRTRAMAKPTLFAQTWIWCSSDKYRCSNGVVQMVER